VSGRREPREPRAGGTPALPRPPAPGGRQRLRCAVVGLGRIGSTLEDDRLREKPASHAGAIRSNRECLLVAGCDLLQERREAFARRWRCPELYSELRPMIEAHRPHILHLATPTETHGLLIAQAAGSGVPLIICEKPLCSSAPEARAAIAACREGGSVLMVNHERRYSRDYRRVRALTQGRRYGALLSIQARVYLGRGQPPGAILLEDGTHMVDIIRFVTGAEMEPGYVHGDPGLPAGALQVLFRCGRADGFLEVSGGHEALVFELELGFEHGRLRIGNGVYEQWESGASRHYESFRSLRAVRTRPWRTTGYFTGMLADAVAVIREPGRVPLSSGLDGLRAVEAIESIVGSARS